MLALAKLRLLRPEELIAWHDVRFRLRFESVIDTRALDDSRSRILRGQGNEERFGFIWGPGVARACYGLVL